MARTSFTVTELNAHIKQLLDADALLGNVCVTGELSNYKVYPSGHHYFTLKDAESSLRCVMFRSSAQSLRFRPASGMSVAAIGRIAVYPRDGAYQLYCTRLIPGGVGDLYAAYEQLKEQLQKEGLFDRAHKKPLPAFPKCIGVVTSKTGAALQDIRNVLTRRWPSVQLLLCPVTVQGFEAAQQVADAIRKLDQRKEVDEIIVARGGGSREDLWVFNAEVIARAAYRCKKPLISAIGHEIDYTILDFVADRRAPTPSAAAELAVPDRAEQKRRLLDLQQNIRKNMQNRLDLCYNGLEQYNFVLEQGPARQSWQKKHDLLQQAKDEIRQQMQAQQHAAELQLQHAAALAGSLNPYKVLARGYAMVTTANGAILDAEGLQPEKTIYVRSVSHRAKCRVEAVEEINENTQKF